MDKIINIFKTGGLSPVTRAVFQAQPGYEKPSDKWSFLNRIFMMAEDTDDARGFNQWKQAGRYVKKGCHAFSIFGPLIKKIKDKETGEDKTFLYGFKTIPVFRYEDTEGQDIPQPPGLNLNIPCDFNKIIEELNLTIKASVFNGSHYGYFAPSRQMINLSSPDIEVFLHELSHAVDNKINRTLKGGQHNDQEVTAEFSAAVIGYMLGYKIELGNCKDYIEAYSFTELMKQLNRCEKVIKFVMERTTTGPALITAPTHAATAEAST